MDSAGYGYYRVWTERAYLLKLATIPFLIKLGCTIVVMVLGYEENVLRQGLILLPGALAEGWVLAQFLRTMLKDERWPTVLPEKVDEALLDKLLLRARGIVAATLVYGLLSLVGYLLRYFLLLFFAGDMSGIENGETLNTLIEEQAQKQAQMSPIYLVPMMALALISFWGFRLMWVYIPFSVLMPVRDYLRELGGLMASLKMLVLYFCAMTPVMFVAVMLSRLVFNMFGDIAEGGDTIAQFLVVFLVVVAETVTGLVTTAAFVWAMRGFLPKNPNVLKEIPRMKD